MEENDDIIYDLEATGSVAESEVSDDFENPEATDSSADSGPAGSTESSDTPDDSDDPGLSDPAMEELGRMVEEMGASTLLDIIRDNRNAAIRQIISEVEAARNHAIPSGRSVAASCSSIFELAAQA